jgi:hypothetical protein
LRHAGFRYGVLPAISIVPFRDGYSDRVGRGLRSALRRRRDSPPCYRLCLTDDPANRRLIETPPPGYDRARYAPLLLPSAEKERLALPFHHRFLIYSLPDMVARDHLFHGHALPNRKRSWNATNFTGAGKRHPTATPAGRRRIAQAHREHALGLMWFLQNDAAMPPDLRTLARAWGFARDEFAAHDNFPAQLYVREARRLAGRTVFTEHDALCAPGAGRAPVHADAVAITEFSLDSLACTTERLPGTGALCDGQLFQMDNSRPGQVPFGALLPRAIDNLLVATTVSATHVAWGTVRQTPTLMHLAEAVAWAIVEAARRRCAPADVPVAALQRTLVQHGVMLSFFNDCDMATPAPWLPAVQVAGPRGFFTDYDTRADEPLDAATTARGRKLGMIAADLTEREGASATRGGACHRWYARTLAATPTMPKQASRFRTQAE